MLVLYDEVLLLVPVALVTVWRVRDLLIVLVFEAELSRESSAIEYKYSLNFYLF